MDSEAAAPNLEQPVVATCARCGTFLRSGEERPLNGQVYCAACVVRPDVDYLEAFRLEHWGKRDGWTWFVGFGGLCYAAAAVAVLVALVIAMNEGEMPFQIVASMLAVAAGAAVCFAFFLGKTWSREAFVALPIVSGLIAAVTNGPSSLLGALIPLLIAMSIYSDTLNKLFFKLEVPREALQKAWNTYSNNKAARIGLAVGIIGLLFVLVPLLGVRRAGLGLIPIGLLGLTLSIVGLSRVAPNANPPVGRKGQAIAGIVLAVLEMGGGAVLAITELSA